MIKLFEQNFRKRKISKNVERRSLFKILSIDTVFLIKKKKNRLLRESANIR